MSNKGRQIEDLLNKISPTASDVTKPLKIIGDGKMIDGVKNIFNYALDEGKKTGWKKGKRLVSLKVVLLLLVYVVLYICFPKE